MTNWKSAITAALTMLPFLLASCTQVLPQENTNTQVPTDSTSQTMRTEKEYEALTTAYEKAQTDLTAAQTRNRDLRAEYDKMKADLGAAQTQSKNLQAEHEKAKTDLSTTQTQNRNLQAEHEKARTDLSVTLAQNKDLQAQYDKAKADLTTSETQKKSLQVEYEKTRTDLGLALDKIKRTLVINIDTGPGVRIEQGNMAVTLHSFLQYKETDSYYIKQLRSGYGYYVADLTVENNSRDKKFSYGRIYTKLQTAEGYVYEYADTSVMSGVSTLGDLPPGERSRFMISFAIPQTAKPAKLTYAAYPGTGAIGFTFEIDTIVTTSSNAPATTTPAAVPTPALTPVPTAPPTPGNSAAQTPLQVKISTLTSAYRSNPVRAKDEYVGKLIEISGQVFSLGESFSGGLYVSIGEDYLSILSSFEKVTAELADNETNRNIVKGLYKGQNVTFIGVIGTFGMEGTVYLKPTSIKYSSLLPKVGG